jgi:hypothetical protein
MNVVQWATNTLLDMGERFGHPQEDKYTLTLEIWDFLFLFFASLKYFSR